MNQGHNQADSIFTTFNHDGNEFKILSKNQPDMGWIPMKYAEKNYIYFPPAICGVANGEIYEISEDIEEMDFEDDGFNDDEVLVDRDDLDWFHYCFCYLYHNS